MSQFFLKLGNMIFESFEKRAPMPPSSIGFPLLELLLEEKGPQKKRRGGPDDWEPDPSFLRKNVKNKLALFLQKQNRGSCLQGSCTLEYQVG